MCGRFAMDKETNDLIEEFVAEGNDFREWRPQYSIAPTDVVPVVRERERDGAITRTIEPAVWDFWPQWMDADKKKRPQFNARLETINTLGLWKAAFQKARCLVPMRGYFEWTGEAGDKQPHFLHGSGTLAAAGVYAPRKNDEGEWYLTVSIITREARDASGEVHDRMPVFLSPDAFSDWLAPVKLDAAQQEATLQLLGAVSEEEARRIRTYPVDKIVSSTRRIDPHDPHLLDPVAGGEA